jgi:GNAT superfamily N-acetyltransferase
VDNLTIRPIEPADVEPVAKLLCDLATEFITGEFEPPARERFVVENNAEAIRGFIATTFRYHVAEIDGELVGFVGVRDNRHLYHLFVARPLQGRGIGRKLWELAKQQCHASGYRGAFTVNSSNHAVPIYELWGFRRDGPPQTSNGITYNPMKLEPEVRCAFCGRTPNQVRFLIEGRTGARICDACVGELKRSG